MNKLAKIESNELEKVVTNSGLAIQEGEEIKQSYIPFIVALAEIQEQSTKINFENPVDIDEKIARDLRLKTVKIRTSASDLKDERKRIFLLKGNLEQAAFNLISASCKLTEETLNNVEKSREIAEKKFKENRKLERIEVLTKLEYDFTFVDILNMPDEQFNKLVLQLENERDLKIQQEKEAELKRIEEIRLNNMATERHFRAIEFKQFWNQDYTYNDFKIMPQLHFDSLICSLIQMKEKHEEKQEQIRIENENLRKANEAKEAELKKEREKAAKEKAAADENLRKANEEKKKLQDEIEREKQADLKAQRDAELKAEDERKAKELEAQKAAKAPDKEKLISWIDSLKFAEIQKNKNNEILVNELYQKFTGFKNWAKQQIETL